MSAGPGEAVSLAAAPAGESGRITLDALRETFGHWRIFEKNGRYWAMRSGMVTAEGPRSLILPFLSALTLDGLAEQLSLQEWLRRMTAEELETVWRHGFEGLFVVAVQDDAGRP